MNLLPNLLRKLGQSKQNSPKLIPPHLPMQPRVYPVSYHWMNCSSSHEDQPLFMWYTPSPQTFLKQYSSFLKCFFSHFSSGCYFSPPPPFILNLVNPIFTLFCLCQVINNHCVAKINGQVSSYLNFSNIENNVISLSTSTRHAPGFLLRFFFSSP